MAIFDLFQDILLVSFGAILGANIRFFIYKQFEKLNFSKSLSISIINSFSSFLLGFFISFQTRISSYNFSYQLLLLISIGLLGSLSTFSAFVDELFNLFMQYKFYRALKLFCISLISGIIALGFGLFLGN
ncbi:CrcB family protein [Prochlorococcus sp. MIT 0916]|uniref:Fluoride-specific ion channel FluC n=1 Tax=Prochlorococcus marinus str. P0903-H212 TaxID=1622208 RepID=A0A0D5A346_PROMR|nr:integral membrane protein possibly involved in chromosome condensation [Prochlorococcus marinus str. P0903-H212]